jgi:hypothetical protein
MVVLELKLPKNKDPEVFAAFMRDEYMAAVRKEPTRAGVVTSISLTQRRNLHAGDDFERNFLMLVGWEGVELVSLPRIDGDAVKAKLESFKLRVTPLGEFNEIADWLPAA